LNNNTIVQKLWSLCDILRDDGITYQQYVTELTLLLFLKMAQETATERHLAQLVDDIDGLDWFTARQDGLGDLYEGLLQKNASEVKVE